MSEGLLARSTKRNLSLGRLLACTLVGGVLTAAYHLVHYMQVHIQENFLFVVLLPPIAVATLGLVLPLLVYITFHDDFRHLNPLVPLHYYQIVVRCLRALERGGGKVSIKDL